MAKKPQGKETNHYEVPLDNSIMQRIKASEIILENEVKGITSDVNLSPQTTKTNESPQKSEQKISNSNEKENNHKNSENVHPNHETENAVNKRESLFDLRKKKKNDSDKPVGETVHHKPAPEKPIEDRLVNQAPIKEDDDEDEENFDFELFPLRIAEKDAVSFLERYNSKLETTIAQSYGNPADLFERSIHGNNTQWYGLRNKGSRAEADGLLIYSLDSHFNRVNILHLTSVSKKGLNPAIEL